MRWRVLVVRLLYFSPKSFRFRWPPPIRGRNAWSGVLCSQPKPTGAHIMAICICKTRQSTAVFSSINLHITSNKWRAGKCSIMLPCCSGWGWRAGRWHKHFELCAPKNSTLLISECNALPKPHHSFLFNHVKCN